MYTEQPIKPKALEKQESHVFWHEFIETALELMLLANVTFIAATILRHTEDMNLRGAVSVFCLFSVGLVFNHIHVPETDWMPSMLKAVLGVAAVLAIASFLVQ